MEIPPSFGLYRYTVNDSSNDYKSQLQGTISDFVKEVNKAKNRNRSHCNNYKTAGRGTGPITLSGPDEEEIHEKVVEYFGGKTMPIDTWCTIENE